ncbi:IclR family transcriptional regulator [Streptomyces sp. SBT349]|uniref:IclR family transcriptional regulator n=1 Tax=Streptomyces sp. SBT349 TaxID=1580539 RepID=UPI00066E9B29|nr:IclR family transcriptional regulator [Streptomyces sp. SBT349]
MVQSVQRAMRILQELMAATSSLGVTELADRLGVAKPTAHALLRTLEAEGAVAQDADSGKYRLGPLLVALGHAYLDAHALRNRSVTWADLLASRVGEAVWVGTLTGDEVLVLHHAFRPGGVAQLLESGATLPWNATALGKAAVAFASPERLQALLGGKLGASTGSSVTDPVELEGQLARVRQKGYAVEANELTLGDAEVAAPVRGRSGEVVGAIGVVGPVERLLADAHHQECAIAVREVARGLSREMGATRASGLERRISEEF